MSEKDDKRKRNRIQGGWAQSTKKKETIKKLEPKPVGIDGFVPQFNQETATNFFNQLSKEKYVLNNIISSVDIMDLNKDQPNLPQDDPAELIYQENFFSDDEATYLFNYFRDNLPWIQRENEINGQKFLEPRKTCWFGLPYGYTGVTLEANTGWDSELSKLMERMQLFAKPGEPLNSVFCNLYETGKNSIAWHSDNESPLGNKPTIVSVSLGSKRVFELCRRDEFYNRPNSDLQPTPYRNRDDKQPPFEGCTILHSVHLRPGSVAVMQGSLQTYWLHRVPKEYHDQEPRINFTFRHIVSG